MPTRQGCLLSVLLLAFVAMILFFGIYPFLAQTLPRSDARMAVIEGWLSDEELHQVTGLCSSGITIVTTGGPVTFGGDLLEQKTYAAVTAARLEKLGTPTNCVLSVPAPDVQMDRTYASAMAVRTALEEQGLFGTPLNLYSTGAHARRSFLLYRSVFGRDYPLGVVSLESSEYDLRHWWRSSLGFKHVVSEFVSWLYTKLSFYKYA